MNPRFRFRLARLQRIRELQERVARGQWAESERQALEFEQRCEIARGDIQRARHELACADGPLDPRQNQLSHRTIDGMLLDLLQRKERAMTQRGQAERLKEYWREREQDRRGLEELEGRERQRHRVALEREEAKEMDELALQRNQRRESPSSPSRPEVDEVSNEDPFNLYP